MRSRALLAAYRLKLSVAEDLLLPLIELLQEPMTGASIVDVVELEITPSKPMASTHVQRIMALTSHLREPNKPLLPQSSLLLQIERVHVAKNVSDTVYELLG